MEGLRALSTGGDKMIYYISHDWATGLWTVRLGYSFRVLDDASWAYIRSNMELIQALGIKSQEAKDAIMEGL